jgi:ABC-type antimicrobial peptide transport system permease subunit
MSKSLISFIKLTFTGFFVICLIGGLIILSIITYTKIIKRKKQIALLTALNAPKKTIFNLYFKENLAVNCASLFALPLAILLSDALNNLIYKYLGLEKIIGIPFLKLYGVPLLFPIILIFGIVIVTFIILGIVFNNIYKKPLILSLNSE